MKKGNKTKRKENREIRKANINTNNDNEMIKLFKIVGIIVAFLVVFITIAYLASETKEEAKTPETTEIQYDNILAGNILKQNPASYYVLVVYEDDAYDSLYTWYLDTYINDNEKAYYYTVELKDAFNKWAVGTDNVLMVDKIEDIRFKETVLLKVKDNKIENSYVGFSAIDAHLKEITKKES